MIRVKYTSTATGTGDIPVSVAAGFEDVATYLISPPYNTVSANPSFQYMLLDANETDWEFGIGFISGGYLYRSFIQSSTNSNAAINLTSGTHTIILPEGGLENRIATSRMQATASPTAGGSAAFSFSGFLDSVDNVYDIPNTTAPTFSTNYPMTGVPFYRAFSFQGVAFFDSGSEGSGFLNVYGINDNIYSTPGAACIIPTDDSSFYGSFKSPLLSNARVDTTSGSVYGGSPSDWRFIVYNTSSSTQTVTLYLTVEWYF